MRIFVARHGSTLWNEQNRICGSTDTPLSKKGVCQAQELAENVVCHSIDRIISSPLTRAVQTSNILANVWGIPVDTDSRLREQDYGIYEGLDRGNAGFLENKRNFATRYPGGESMMQMACRVYGFLEKMACQYPSETLLLITHGGVCRILRTYFKDMTNEEFFHYTQENAKLEEYLLKPGAMGKGDWYE